MRELTIAIPVRRAASVVISGLLILFSVSGLIADDSLVLLPSKFTITGSKARQSLIVQELRDGQLAGEITEAATFHSSDPKVLRIENGVAIPVGDGRATLSATIDNRTATATVTVEYSQQPHRWSFRNHVQSVLSKAGCNSGACHGAAAGKNGFKLALRGYDAEFDFRSITRQSRGRRIVPGDPGRSLFLLKPTGAVPHKGGVRIDVDSLDYRVLAEWLAAGHPGPDDDDPRIERLEILPEHAILKPSATQQMIVRAHFSDGHAEDVTRWAKYTSTNLTVAKVDEAGRLSVTGNGEGAIVAWYLSKNIPATISVPYENDVPLEVYSNAPRGNFVDDFVHDKLVSLKIPPSRPAGDATFLRRASLDTIGVLPTAEEARAFLDDQSPDKRNRLVDDLLARPEFVDYWAYKWCDLLLVTSARLPAKAVESYYQWIRTHVADDTPWDELVREVVTAKGSTYANGASNFYSLHEDPLTMAETVSMAFLGMSINCARCHDHPLEKWTNDDYYGMANMFARVRGKTLDGAGNRSIFASTAGELVQPRTGRPQPPRPLDGEPVAFTSTVDRRLHLAEWLTSPSNPYFSRAIANRIWANFMGVGIVEKVDDMRLTNPPSNEALLAGLADFLEKNNYNLKRLMRLILTSQTYQRSSHSVPSNEEDERYYSRFFPRRLKAEVLLDAVSQATGAPTQFSGYPFGTRALQLRDTNVASYFLKTFGRPERIITCECERSDDPSMVQVLHILNGDTLNNKLEARGNRIDEFLKANIPNEKMIEEIYLSTLTRFPTADEKSAMLKVLAETEQQKSALIARIETAFQETLARETSNEEKKTIQALLANEKHLVVEDLFWSILSSKEFLFQH